MDPRLFALTLPSLAVLALLVAHSLRALPRRRALAFWIAVAGYGVARGAAVVWITRTGLGARPPYVIHEPLFAVLGVPLQEVAGWAIVAYLGWWLGGRLSDRLFAQVAWACLFLGAVSWAVESAAVAAGWWHWTVPLSGRLLGGAPWIGLVDWFFVGTDFLLPFAALTARAPAGRGGFRRWRWLTLVAFPAHFAAHLAPERIAGWLPVPGHHLAHWLLLAILLWLALRARIEDRPFTAEPPGAWSWAPAAALAVVLIDVAVVQALVAGRPELLPSVLPALAVALASLRPVAAVAMAWAFGGLALVQPPFALAAVPAVAGSLLRARPRRRRSLAPLLVLALAATALAVHHRGAAGDRDLRAGLDAALAARDRGDLAAARDRLAALHRDHPGSPVPPFLLAEIHYRTGRPAAARPLFQRAVEIQQSLTEGYRYLAVIDLRAGDRAAAARAAERGLAIAPDDPELIYLAIRAGGRDLTPVLRRIDRSEGPDTARTLATLAFEVGDPTGAAAIVDHALARWPEDRGLQETRERLEPAGGT